MKTESEYPPSYRLVCFHDTERKSEIMHLHSGEYPKGWSSISPGFPTVEELKEKQKIADDPCSVCGSPYSTNYSGVADKMKQRNMCFSCNFWQDIAERQDDTCVRVAGKHYVIGAPNAGKNEFRGFGGRAFKIRFFDARGEVETTNLWHQGDIPKHFQKLIPDNAEFVKP